MYSKQPFIPLKKFSLYSCLPSCPLRHHLRLQILPIIHIKITTHTKRKPIPPTTTALYPSIISSISLPPRISLYLPSVRDLVNSLPKDRHHITNLSLPLEKFIQPGQGKTYLHPMLGQPLLPPKARSPRTQSFKCSLQELLQIII